MAETTGTTQTQRTANARKASTRRSTAATKRSTAAKKAAQTRAQRSGTAARRRTSAAAKSRATRGANKNPKARPVAHQGARQYGQESNCPMPRWIPRPRGSSSTSP